MQSRFFNLRPPPDSLLKDDPTKTHADVRGPHVKRHAATYRAARWWQINETRLQSDFNWLNLLDKSFPSWLFFNKQGH